MRNINLLLLPGPVVSFSATGLAPAVPFLYPAGFPTSASGSCWLPHLNGRESLIYPQKLDLHMNFNQTKFTCLLVALALSALHPVRAANPQTLFNFQVRLGNVAG